MLKKKRTAEKSTKRNPDQTRQLLLDKATQVFSENGFKGGALSLILKETNVNKRMIYHYFGDKDGLYRAVLLNQWRQLRQWLSRAINPTEAPGPLDDRSVLFATLNSYLDFLAEHPEFVRLTMWDGLAGGQLSASIWDEARIPVFDRIAELIRVAQAKGIVASDLSPAHFIISFMGSTTFYFAHTATMEKMLKTDPTSKKALQERKEQLFLQLEHLISPSRQ